MVEDIIKDPTLTQLFTEIADAIRTRTERTEPIKPVDFASEIESIQGGADIDVYSTMEEMNTVVPESISRLSLVYDETNKINKGLYECKEVDDTTKIRVPLLGGDGFHSMILDKTKLLSVLNKALKAYGSSALGYPTYMPWWIGNNGKLYAGWLGSSGIRIGSVFDANSNLLGVGDAAGISGTSNPSLYYMEMYIDSDSVQGYSSTRKYSGAETIRVGNLNHFYWSNVDAVTEIMRAEVTSNNITEPVYGNQYLSVNPTTSTTIFEPYPKELKNVAVPYVTPEAGAPD